MRKQLDDLGLMDEFIIRILGWLMLIIMILLD